MPLSGEQLPPFCFPMSLQIVPLISIQCGKRSKIKKKKVFKKLKLVHTQVENHKQEHHSQKGDLSLNKFFRGLWQPECVQSETFFLSSNSAPDPGARSFTPSCSFPWWQEMEGSSAVVQTGYRLGPSPCPVNIFSKYYN